ncbi:hypothetical protein POM88_023030 [Heracleum sosnowskyi]|uniref:Uncharacterized protein n=1 Tax=Heracleum sosnowskyi TaxID=360622 RepID=A0AAD8IGG5_9APIA|nr:hypothetical protein POM88_023030 [Heracleum sosnowskyi]
MNSFEVLREQAKEKITNVQIERDADGNAKSYSLTRGSKVIHKLGTNFTTLKKHEKISYIEVERMLDILEGYGNTYSHLLEPVQKYHDERYAEFCQKYGDWRNHADEDIVCSSDEELPAEDIVYPESEYDVWVREEAARKARELRKRHVEQMESDLMKKCRRLNRANSLSVG